MRPLPTQRDPITTYGELIGFSSNEPPPEVVDWVLLFVIANTVISGACLVLLIYFLRHG